GAAGPRAAVPAALRMRFEAQPLGGIRALDTFDQLAARRAALHHLSHVSILSQCARIIRWPHSFASARLDWLCAAGLPLERARRATHPPAVGKCPAADESEGGG